MRTRKKSQKQQNIDKSTDEDFKKKYIWSQKQLAKLQQRQARNNGSQHEGQQLQRMSLPVLHPSDEEYKSEEETIMGNFRAPEPFQSQGVVQIPSPPCKKLKRASEMQKFRHCDKENDVTNDTDQALHRSHTRLLPYSTERHSSPSPAISSHTGDGRSSPLGDQSTGTSPVCSSLPALSEPEPDTQSRMPIPLRVQTTGDLCTTVIKPRAKYLQEQMLRTQHRMPAYFQSTRRARTWLSREDPVKQATAKPIGYMNPDSPTCNSKPNRSDYVSRTKSLISKAIELYMIRIFTTDLFPGAMVAAEWATDDWRQVCNTAGETLTLQILIVLLSCLKQDQTRKEIKTANKKLVEYLQEGESPRFCYEDRLTQAHQVFNSDNLQFYAEPRIILRRIKDNLFKSAEDVGVCYRSAFDPIPVLLLTAGLTMWCGESQALISEDAYKKKYNNHMKQLKKWTNINPEGVKAVRAQQYKRILE
ncbi:hypothetical protein BC835DRAFT_1307228 [Cytidiella melzeri]|nr:hypothetical protein BC835DRAFT_1307228 [Cytidiella melzeri]